MVVEPVVVVVVPACTQLVYALATVVRAAGPGGTVEVTRADGDTLTVRSATAVGQAGADRR